GRVVVADLDARRFPLEHRVSVDADVEVGEDGQPPRREHGALFGWRDQVLRLTGSVRSQRKAKFAAVDPGKQRVCPEAGRQDETLGSPLTSSRLDRDQALLAADPVDRSLLLDRNLRRVELRHQRSGDRRYVEKARLDVEPTQVDVELGKAGEERVANKGLRLEVQALEHKVALLCIGGRNVWRHTV